MAENPDLARLATYRLEQDLTWEELAAEMAAAGYPLQARALHNVLTRRVDQPMDRTLFKIRRFLEWLDHKPPRRRREVTT